jgi:hypothetical protein
VLFVVPNRTHPGKTHEPGIRHPEIPVSGPGLGVGAGIIDRDVQLQLGLAHTLVAFDEMQLLGVWVSQLIQQRAIVGADRIDD